MNLPELLILSRDLHVELGEISGTCCVCGNKTETGHRINFSGNFTNWDILQFGDCICEKCNILFQDQIYRRSSWIATVDEFKTGKARELITFLENPAYPFAMYLTWSGKKQGYLYLIDAVNESEYVTIGFDYDIYSFSIPDFIDYYNEVKSLLVQNVIKTELLTGNFRFKTFEKLGRKKIEELEQRKKVRLWQLAIKLA